MLFTTHGITGGALAVLTGNATVGFVAGFALHHILDYVPHCDPGSFINKSNVPGEFTKEQLIVAIADFVIGVALITYLYFSLNLDIIFLAGVIGGVLPDVLGVAPVTSKLWHGTKIGHVHGLFHRKWHNTLPWRQAFFGLGFQLLLVVVSIYYLYNKSI
jgi:hypothetical protein